MQQMGLFLFCGNRKTHPRVCSEINSGETQARLDKSNEKITQAYVTFRRINYIVKHDTVWHVLEIPWMAATSWRLGFSATVGIIVGEPWTKK